MHMKIVISKIIFVRDSKIIELILFDIITKNTRIAAHIHYIPPNFI